MKQFLLKYTFFHELGDERSDGVKRQKIMQCIEQGTRSGNVIFPPIYVLHGAYSRVILPALVAVKKTIKFQSLSVYHQRNKTMLLDDSGNFW